MTMLRSLCRQAGTTLVELVVSIVVISVGLAGVLIVMDRTTRASADPLIQHQAIAIGEAYLEEILTKAYADPDTAESGSAEGGETRPTYDDVNDYNSLPDTVVRDQSGTAIAALAGYSVAVLVATDATLNGLTARRVQVTVTPPAGSAIVLAGYRADY
jgi:MSHA pilin protein MshD